MPSGPGPSLPPMKAEELRPAEEELAIEEADAWFEYLEMTRAEASVGPLPRGGAMGLGPAQPAPQGRQEEANRAAGCGVAPHRRGQGLLLPWMGTRRRTEPRSGKRDPAPKKDMRFEADTLACLPA